MPASTAFRSLFVIGMQGLGDNIFQRAVVRLLPRNTYLETSWPQLYADLPIRCVRPSTKLRTQAKNINRIAAWYRPPHNATVKRVHYVSRGGTILQSLYEAAGVQGPVVFDLPPLKPQNRKPYIVIRPATIRTEWLADSRNPRPEYLALAAEKLRAHFHIISVADLVPGVEWPVLPLPYADETFHKGELPVESLLSLVAGASAVVGGVGWLVPAAVAVQVPMFLIFGGWGIHHGPARIFDPRMNTELIHQAIPQRFCMCGRRDHACDKRINDIEVQLDEWIVGLLARRTIAMAAGARDRILPSHSAAIRQGLLGTVSEV